MRENSISAQEKRTEKFDEVQKLPISELHPFENQPFKVLPDESMTELAESIKSRGVLTPIAVRPHPDGGYEILSGHRRVKACELMGLSTVPAKIFDLNDDMAIIFLIDSNIQRDRNLPSEKTFAYQMKLDAMKRQGLCTDLTTSSQFGTRFRSDEAVAKECGESRNQIQRYIRLTHLIYQLLDMVDTKKISVNAAVELSYIGTKAQSDIAQIIVRDEIRITIKQAVQIRSLFEDGKIDFCAIEETLLQRKTEKMDITLKETKIRKYFPKEYSKKEIENVVTGLVKQWAAEQKKRNIKSARI